MANELTTTTDPAAQSKAVAAFALSTTWTMAQAMTMAEAVDVPAVIAGYERGLIPLSAAEPRGMSVRDPSKPGRLSTGLGDDLALLWTKVSPTASVEQADAWIKVMVLALSDLPGRVAREAAQAALHRPMQFANQVESVIRDIAADIAVRHAMALRRLRDLRSALARAADPALTGPGPDVSFTVEQIRAMSPDMRSMGIGCGALTQDDIDAALAEPMEQLAA